MPEITSSAFPSTPMPASTGQKTMRDKLDRIRRQLALENDLSLDVDESENLGIEQVCKLAINILECLHDVEFVD